MLRLSELFLLFFMLIGSLLIGDVQSKEEPSAAVWFGKKFGKLMLMCMNGGGMKGKAKAHKIGAAAACPPAWYRANFTSEEKRLFHVTVADIDKFETKTKFYEAVWEKSKVEQYGWALLLMEALKAIETVEKATEWKTNEKLSPSVKGLLTQLENSIESCKQKNENGLPNVFEFLRLFNTLHKIESESKDWNETDKEILKRLLDWQNLILEFLGGLVDSPAIN